MGAPAELLQQCVVVLGADVVLRAEVRQDLLAQVRCLCEREIQQMRYFTYFEKMITKICVARCEKK